MQKYSNRYVHLGRTARSDVRAMAGVMPLFELHLGKPISSWAFAADAERANECDAGVYGVVYVWAGESLMWEAGLMGVRSVRAITRLDGRLSPLLNRRRQLEARTRVSRAHSEIVDLGRHDLIHGRWKLVDDLSQKGYG